MDNVAAFIFWGADQAIFGDQAPPKWSHASLIAPSSQFDILIDVVGQLGKASVDVRFWRVRDVSAKVPYLLPATSTVSIFHSNTDGMLCVRTNIMPDFSEQQLLLTSQWSLHVKIWWVGAKNSSGALQCAFYALQWKVFFLKSMSSTVNSDTRYRPSCESVLTLCFMLAQGQLNTPLPPCHSGQTLPVQGDAMLPTHHAAARPGHR